jgi:membrane protein DedA with SNARE-associated domain
VFSPVGGWLREHLYPVVFLGAILEAIGLPFPGRLMLIAAGSFSLDASRAASEGDASAPALIALATIGTVVGDHVWYLVGRLKGRRLFEIYCRLFRLSDAKVRAANRLLRRFGGLAIVLARAAATLRIVVTPLAVSRGMSYRRFVAFDLLGALLWVTGFISLGRAVGVLASGSSLVGVLAIIGVLGAATAVLSVLARRHVPASPSCAD